MQCSHSISCSLLCFFLKTTSLFLRGCVWVFVPLFVCLFVSCFALLTAVVGSVFRGGGHVVCHKDRPCEGLVLQNITMHLDAHDVRPLMLVTVFLFYMVG